MSLFGLTRTTELTLSEIGQDFVEAYFKQFPASGNIWMAFVARPRATGYVETLLGRRPLLPGAHRHVEPDLTENREERESHQCPHPGTGLLI